MTTVMSNPSTTLMNLPQSGINRAKSILKRKKLRCTKFISKTQKSFQNEGSSAACHKSINNVAK